MRSLPTLPLPRLLPWIAAAIAAPALPAQSQQVLYPVQDTFVQDTNPDGSFGSSDLWFGRGSFFGLGNIRTLVQFDLSTLPADPRQIRAAKFSAYQYSTEAAAGGLPCELHAAAAAWSEATASWNNQPPYDARVWSTADVGDSFYTGPIAWDATALVREHLSGALPNLGWLFRMQFETAGASRLGYFYSTETAGSAAVAPQLAVEVYELLLNATDLTAGQNATVAVSGADPRRPVAFAFSTTGLGSTPVAQFGVTLELDAAILLAVDRTGPAGNAAVTFLVPALALGRPYWLQACAQNRLSNWISGVVQ